MPGSGPIASESHAGTVVGSMKRLHPSLRIKAPFLVAGFLSFLFSVWLYFVQDEQMAGIFVGLWVPSIHSLGTLVLTPVDDVAKGSSAPQERTEVSV